MEVIFVRDLQESDSPAVISDSEAIASYSWIEAPTPTIAVPGMPAEWCDPGAARALPKDSGTIYIAQNAARHPESPLEPLFRAVYMLQPDFDMGTVDVVTDRNNLRKLLSFVDPSTDRKGREAFTINAEVAGNTLILSRTETKVQEFVGPYDFIGFGHEYEKASTNNEIRESTGYHRIVSYSFGGLRFLVRHEVDGYVGDGHTGTAPQTVGATSHLGLPGLLQSMSLTGNASSLPIKDTHKPAGSKMTIREQGRVVPTESTLEIKTRASKNAPIAFEDVAAQIWASQTPKLVRAYHYRGSFQPAQVEDLTDKVRRWERAHERCLKRLATLLDKIISAVKGMKGSAVIRHPKGVELLVVEATESKPMLPKDLYARWAEPAAKSPEGGSA